VTRVEKTRQNKKGGKKRASRILKKIESARPCSPSKEIKKHNKGKKSVSASSMEKKREKRQLRGKAGKGGTAPLGGEKRFSTLSIAEEKKVMERKLYGKPRGVLAAGWVRRKRKSRIPR